MTTPISRWDKFRADLEFLKRAIKYRDGGVAILIPSHPSDSSCAVYLQEIPDYLVYNDRAYVFDRDGKPSGGVFGFFKTRVSYFRCIGKAHDMLSYEP